MEYMFHTSAYDVDLLVPEVSEALARREELESRRRLPGMWKATDNLSRRGNGAGRMTRGRLIYRRVVGAALIVLGVFMLIPGLREPEELLFSLIAGICGVAIGIHALWSARKQPAKEPGAEPEKKLAVKPTKRHESTARAFLENLAKVGPTSVRFSEEGMWLGEHTVISYGEMGYFLETQSGYLLTWGRQATFLQKRDLEHGDEGEFRAFVEGGMPRV